MMKQLTCVTSQFKSNLDKYERCKLAKKNQNNIYWESIDIVQSSHVLVKTLCLQVYM